MALVDALWLALAALLAGALNAVAGGGSFLTLPALLAAGVPPVAANATGTVALLPGYLSASWASRHDLVLPRGASLMRVLVLALMGGALGASLLLLTSDHLFAMLAPPLLLAATGLFVLQPRLRAKGPESQTSVSRTLSWLPLFAVCIYGGYFNGGLGILLLTALMHAGLRSLHAANALKNQVSAMLTAIAVSIYALGGAVNWGAAAWMAAFALLGGYLGARFARRIPAPWLRKLVIALGLTMALLLAGAQYTA